MTNSRAAAAPSGGDDARNRGSTSYHYMKIDVLIIVADLWLSRAMFLPA